MAAFKCAKVKVNFGPKFRFPPKALSDGSKPRPMCARADQAATEQALSDMRFFAEKEGKLKLDDYFRRKGGN